MSHNPIMEQMEQALEKREKAPRRKRTAHVTELCTGCGGAPVCMIYCKFNALTQVDAPDNYPFKITQVDASRCTGCGACVARGTLGMFTTGCPWNAIVLVATEMAPALH